MCQPQTFLVVMIIVQRWCVGQTEVALVLLVANTHNWIKRHKNSHKYIYTKPKMLTVYYYYVNVLIYIIYFCQN